MCWRKPKTPTKEESDCNTDQSKPPPNFQAGPGPVAWRFNILPPFESVPGSSGPENEEQTKNTLEGVPVSTGPNYDKQKKTIESEWIDPHPKQDATYISSTEPCYKNSNSSGTKAEKPTKTTEPDRKPPPTPETTYIPSHEPHKGNQVNQLQQSNSNSYDTKARNSKKPSGSDQEPTGPEVRAPNTSLPTTTERPKLSSDSEDQVTRKFKTPASGFDQKSTGPEARMPNTSQPITTERPKLSSDSEDQVTRKVSEIKRPPLLSPEKQKMISRESSLENTPHKCPTTYKFEEKTTECNTSAPEKQNAFSNDKRHKNSSRAIRSSQTTEKEDTESISNDHNSLCDFQTVPSDSEGNQKPQKYYW